MSYLRELVFGPKAPFRQHRRELIRPFRFSGPCPLFLVPFDVPYPSTPRVAAQTVVFDEQPKGKPGN